MELYYAYGDFIILFLYFNSKLHVISVISHVMFENIPPAQHPVLQQDASSLLLVYFLVSIKPLIRVSYFVTFGSRLCFEDPSSKKWPEQLPQRFDPTTSRSAICHNSIGTTRKSRFQLGACSVNECWPRAIFPLSATQLLSWELCQVDLWRRS